MYNKEDLKFLNMEVIKTLNKGVVFEIEEELSEDEKVQFIDEYQDGIASYMLDLFNKWNEEKQTLPQDTYKQPKTVSKKAWIKRNDNRNIIDTTFDIGRYYLFGNEFSDMSLICPTGKYGKRMLYTNKNIVNQWFHDLCVKLHKEEEVYFKSINPFHVKIAQIQQYANKYDILDNTKINDIMFANIGYENNVTEVELDIFIEAYKKIEAYYKNVINDLNCKLQNITTK